MQLVGGDLKAPDGRQGDAGDERGAVSVEETVEPPSDSVVVDEPAVALFQPECHLVVVRHPLAQRVERGPLADDVAQQHPEGLGHRQLRPGVGGQLVFEHGVDAEALQEGPHDRQGTDGAALELEGRVPGASCH